MFGLKKGSLSSSFAESELLRIFREKHEDLGNDGDCSSHCIELQTKLHPIFSGATEQPATDEAQSCSRAPVTHHKGNMCIVQDKKTILIFNIHLLVLDEMRKLHEAYQLCRKMMQNKRVRKSVNGRKMKNGK